MKKTHLEEYLQDILEKVEKVVEEQDEQAIEDLTSYIHVSKDLMRYYKTTEGANSTVEKAYSKISEAEEKVMEISRQNYKKSSSFDLREVFNTFVESLSIFSKG